MAKGVVHHAELVARLLDDHARHGARRRLRQDGRRAGSDGGKSIYIAVDDADAAYARAKKRPARRSSRNWSTATMAAANSSAAIRKAMSGLRHLLAEGVRTGWRNNFTPAVSGFAGAGYSIIAKTLYRAAAKIASQSRCVSRCGRDLVQRPLDLGAIVDAAALDAEAFEETARERRRRRTGRADRCRTPCRRPRSRRPRRR